MTYLDNWSDIIQRQAEASAKQQDEYLERLKAGMPEAIAKLGSHDHETLFALYDQFSGGRVDPREVVLREEFRNAVKAEIVRRMLK